jgi:hypothetical protein
VQENYQLYKKKECEEKNSIEKKKGGKKEGREEGVWHLFWDHFCQLPIHAEKYCLGVSPLPVEEGG